MNRPDERIDVTDKKIGALSCIGRLYMYTLEGAAWTGTASVSSLKHKSYTAKDGSILIYSCCHNFFKKDNHTNHHVDWNRSRFVIKGVGRWKLRKYEVPYTDSTEN